MAASQVCIMHGTEQLVWCNCQHVHRCWERHVLTTCGMLRCVFDSCVQPPEPTPIQTFADEGFVPPPTPESAFTHK